MGINSSAAFLTVSPPSQRSTRLLNSQKALWIVLICITGSANLVLDFLLGEEDAGNGRPPVRRRTVYYRLWPESKIQVGNKQAFKFARFLQGFGMQDVALL